MLFGKELFTNEMAHLLSHLCVGYAYRHVHSYFKSEKRSVNPYAVLAYNVRYRCFHCFLAFVNQF